MAWFNANIDLYNYVKLSKSVTSTRKVVFSLNLVSKGAKLCERSILSFLHEPKEIKASCALRDIQIICRGGDSIKCHMKCLICLLNSDFNSKGIIV